MKQILKVSLAIASLVFAGSAFAQTKLKWAHVYEAAWRRAFHE